MRSDDHTNRRRILVTDDNAAIHEDFRKIFRATREVDDTLAQSEAALFGEAVSVEGVAPRPCVQIDSATQGQDALAMVRRAREEGSAYAVAFIDVRMPPGWDGIETTSRIWAEDPDIQVVICTAYSDYSWDRIIGRLGCSDRLVILKKPFDNIEVLQLATALIAKWSLHRQLESRLENLEHLVDERTRQLRAATQRAREMAQAALVANRAKSEFLARVGQEIRAPMDHIMRNAELLLHGSTADPERVQVEAILGNGRALLRVVDDVLDFANDEARSLEEKATRMTDGPAD